jgi:hypothetical protein
LLALGKKEWIVGDEERADPPLNKGGKGCVELSFGASAQSV